MNCGFYTFHGFAVFVYSIGLFHYLLVTPERELSGPGRVVSAELSKHLVILVFKLQDEIK